MYKYCLVPECKNTTIKTPEKLFFNVPKIPKLREKWCSIVKRYNKTPLSDQCTRHCCEDHFDLEEDMENYIKYKLVGGQLRLKKGVVPHKFECRNPPKKKIERTGFKKRQNIEFFKRVLSKDIEHEDLLLHPIEVVVCENQDSNITQNRDPLDIPKEIDVSTKKKKKSRKTRAVQVNMQPKMINKSTSTPLIWKQNIGKNS